MVHRPIHRINLWLRCEKAMGLDAVRRPGAGRQSARKPVPCSADQATGIEPRPSPAADATATPPVTLFGADVSAPALKAPASVESFLTPPLPTEQKRQLLAALDANEVRGCTRCRLCENRTNTVFGEGNPDALVFFIGEGPGENEDLQGRPFVGRAGDLLNRMIAGMGLKREQVFIANLVKCRPPGNRTPQADEVATCTPYLQRQLDIIRPTVIVTLGLPATQYMLQRNVAIGRARGQWHTWRGIKLMPTYHPAYVLRSYTRQVREAVWGDLQKVMLELGLPISAHDQSRNLPHPLAPSSRSRKTFSTRSDDVKFRAVGTVANSLATAGVSGGLQLKWVTD